jgi:bacillithiol system protein YtxJ
MAEYRLLTSADEVAPLFEESSKSPVLFFKHSLTCPISGAAFREYEEFLAARPEGEAVYTLVELQNARPVSAAITETSGVRHESPQAILVHSGEVVWHASHWKIRRDALENALADAQS